MYLFPSHCRPVEGSGQKRDASCLFSPAIDKTSLDTFISLPLNYDNCRSVGIRLPYLACSLSKGALAGSRKRGHISHAPASLRRMDFKIILFGFIYDLPFKALHVGLTITRACIKQICVTGRETKRKEKKPRLNRAFVAQIQFQHL